MTMTMTLKLGHGEPEALPWRRIALAAFVQRLLQSAGRPEGRLPIVALDGRSSSGKTTLAGRISRAVPGCCVVHTDDIAWFHSRFGWTDLMVGSVLEPLHQGRAVSFRPPAWDERGRSGSIEIATGTSLVVIEGVGASRSGLAHLLDATVWVQADLRDVETRNAERVRSGETHESGVAGWMAEEFPFIEHDRPWKRATYITCGSAVVPHDRATDVIVSDSRQPAR
jgi:hypothetical protein